MSSNWAESKQFSDSWRDDEERDELRLETNAHAEHHSSYQLELVYGLELIFWWEDATSWPLFWRLPATTSKKVEEGII